MKNKNAITPDKQVIHYSIDKLQPVKEMKSVKEVMDFFKTETEAIVFFKKDVFKSVKNKRAKEPIEKLPSMLKISQNHSINALRNTITGASAKRTPSKMVFSVDDMEEKAISTMQGKRKGFKTEIYIHEFGTIKHLLKSDKLNKLLDLIFYYLDKQGYKGCVEFRIENFLEYIGNKVTENNKKSITKELKPILETLYNFSISSKEGARDFAFVRPFPRAEIKRGKIIVGIEEIFARSVDKRYFIMPKEVGLLKNAGYYIACYIYMYARQANKKEFKLRYETLYEYSGLPRYEELKTKGGITRKIIEPFLKALYQIKEILGDNITIKEAVFNPESWEAFRQAKIEIKLPNLQDTVIAINKKRKEATQKGKH